MAITAETRTAIIQLVVTAYDAAPGTTLLTELVAIVDGGGSLADVATNLTTRTEWTSKYPSFQTSGEFGAEWLGALVPEASADSLAAGVVVVEGLVAGGSTFAEIIIAAQGFLAALPTTDVAFGTSAANFANKVTVATYQTISLEQAGAGSLAGVTSDVATVASVNAAASAVVNAVASTTTALTTGLDTGAAFTGGTGDDTFVGVNNNLATAGTLNSGDNLVGGEGSDTLSIVASGTATAPLVSTSSIETLAIANNTGSGYSLNTSLMTGLTGASVTGGNAATTVTASQANLDITANSTTFGITTTSAVPSAGAADAIAINLSGVGRSGNPTILSDGIETFNVALGASASGSQIAAALSTITLDSNQLETVNITGSTAANLTAVLQGVTAFNQVGTVDASAATGNLMLTVTAGTSSDDKTIVSLGAGDDQLTIGALDKDFTITGGEGSDTLVATASAPGTTLPAASYVGVGVSGFEVISAAGAGAVDFRSLANNTTFIATTGAGTYSKAGAGIADSYLTATTGTLTLTRGTDTAADALNVHIQSATAGTVTATAVNEETVTIAAAGSGSGITHNLSLNVTDATTLNVIGSNGLNISSLVGETNLATIAAGTHTGSVLTVNASGSTKAITVTGSAGNEASLGATVNTITTGTGADIVAGGAFADTLTTGTGNDSVTAGAGNDTITTAGGNDTVDAGAGNDTITGGTGSDSLIGGAGNDNIDAGSGADTIDAGAGNDLIVATLTDSTSVDGGAGTDRVSASTAAITSTTAAGVNAQFITVSDSVKPGLTGVESLHVTMDGAGNTTAATATKLDLTNATSLTSLFFDTDDGGSEFINVTNFAGSSATLYGGDSAISATAESDNLTFDGIGQAALTLNLQGFVAPDTGGAGNSTLAVTGVQGLTIAGDSTSQLTGSADQDNKIGALTANGATSLKLSSSGSAATNAAAFTTGAISVTGANAIEVASGAFDDFDVAGDITAAGAVETAIVSVGTDSQMTLADLIMTGSALLSTNITLGDGAFLSNSNANTAIAAAEAVDIVATSVADFNVTLGAGANAALDVQGVAMTDADFTIGASSTLVLGTSVGVAGSPSNFKISGRGDFDDTDDNAIGSEFNVLGTTVTFDQSGLTTDTDATTIVASSATVKATIKTNLGADTITGSGFADVLSSGAGDDSILGGAGADSITMGTGTDEVSFSDVTAATSHSLTNLAGMAINNSAAAVTAATVATAMGGTIVIGGGAAVAGAALAAGSAGYLTTASGNSLATMVRDTFSGVEDITGSGLGDYIVGGATASSIAGGNGVDVILGGIGADTVTGGGGADKITSGTGADIIKYAAATAAALGTETGATAATDVDFVTGTAGDTITGFVSGTDKLHFITTLTNNGTDSDTLVTIGAGGVVANNAIFVETVAAAIDGTHGSAVTLLNAHTTSAIAINEDVIFFVHDGTDGYLYLLTQLSTANTIAAQDLTLIGQLTGVTNVADGDFVSY